MLLNFVSSYLGNKTLDLTLWHWLSQWNTNCPIFFFIITLGIWFYTCSGKKQRGKNKSEEVLLQIMKQPTADLSTSPQETDRPVSLSLPVLTQMGCSFTPLMKAVSSFVYHLICPLLLLFYPLSSSVSYFSTYIFCPNTSKCVKLVFACEKHSLFSNSSNSYSCLKTSVVSLDNQSNAILHFQFADCNSAAIEQNENPLQTVFSFLTHPSPAVPASHSCFSFRAFYFR